MDVNENHEIQSILGMILDLLQTAKEGARELLHRLTENDIPTSIVLLQDLEAVFQAISSVYPKIESNLEKSFSLKMLKNLSDSIDEICNALEQENYLKATTIAEFQLLPFISLLWEDFYFWGSIYPDKNKMDKYYKTEFASHYKNPYIENKTTKFEISIVVAAYNHLDKTKECVESIIRNTDFEGLNAELILIDHGSTDGTLEYFQSIGVKKVIKFKENIRIGMFSFAAQICEGKYFAFVSNDTIVTPKWLEILLNCVRSDSKIISATPTTPNTSNLQSLSVPTVDKIKFLQYAETNNQSNPKRWFDRSRVMPVICLYNLENMNQIGYADPYYYSLEFWDDDFSLRAKRAGFRQLVCEDVYCYHYGSETGRETQQKENTFVSGRELFQYKNGLDPWKNGFCYDLNAVELLLKFPVNKHENQFLGIDCGLGDTPLHIKSRFRNSGCNIDIDNITTNPIYEADLKIISNQFALVNQSNIANELENFLSEKKYDYIYLSNKLEKYDEYKSLLKTVSQRMNKNGKFVFSITNPYYAITIYQLLQLALPSLDDPVSFISPGPLKRYLESIFSEVVMMPLTATPKGLDSFMKEHFKAIRNKKDLTLQLSTQEYYFLCTK